MLKKFVCILICMMLLSCKSYEEEVFHALKFNANGIELVHSASTGAYEGTIPPTGCTFTLTGKSDFSQFVYITSIQISDITQNGKEIYGDLKPPHLGASSILSGEWGEIEYLNDCPPYTIEFRISPNCGYVPRSIAIQLGYGYWISNINLNQQNIDY